MEMPYTNYELYELKIFSQEIEKREKEPLQVRKENKQSYLEALNNDLDRIFKLFRCVIEGSYGAGPYLAFRRLSKRTNRRAYIFNYFGCLEYGCTIRDCCKVWHQLDTDLQAAINAELDIIIKDYDTSEKK